MHRYACNTYAIFYMRDFKRVGTNGENCDPSVKKQRANDFSPLRESPPRPRRV